MIEQNPSLAKLKKHYLFPEIEKRKQQFLATHPNASLISLGIGDTPGPLAPSVQERIQHVAEEMATSEGFHGYGPAYGYSALREAISQTIYAGSIDPEDIFISDGSKCDIARLQMLFGASTKIAVQDPVYPVYVDSSVIMGQTGAYNRASCGYTDITYLPCTAENHFFPELEKAKASDIIFFCSPNNPTGTAASFCELEQLVTFARKEGKLIVFDAAYQAYIRDHNYPKSIFDIPHAKQVAIESGSFSKMAAFTGLRLGWTVVPKELRYTSNASIREDWCRIVSTLFNGASYLVQQAGIAALSKKAAPFIKEQQDSYLLAAKKIKDTLEKAGLEVYGGDHIPYVWARFEGRQSWEVFSELLENAHLITTPGVGFGPSGEGFVRFSGFQKIPLVEKACKRLERALANVLVGQA